jgi:CBS domain-containing protein
MKISDVVRRKGDLVVTVKPDETVERLLDLLAEHKIGAVVVSDDGETVGGIVSERDVVRHLQRSGAGVLARPVSQIMTSEVTTTSTSRTSPAR